MKLHMAASSVVLSLLALWSGSAQAYRICIGASAPSATTTVSQAATGGYHYLIMASGGYNGAFTCGTAPDADKSGYMSDFFLPYFADMGLTNIAAGNSVNDPVYGNIVLGQTGFMLLLNPGATAAGSGWSYQIEADNNMFNLGGGALHFHATTTPTSLDYNVMAISFDASYSGVKAPFYSSITDLRSNTSSNYLGDPDIPGSPQTVQALADAAGQVPEPGSIFLLGAGLLGFLARRRGTK